MQLNEIRPVYDAQKPFITVYLEGRPPADDAHKQVRLRWDGRRSRLSEAGATDEALQALDAAVLDSESGEVHTNGRVLVADVSRVVLDDAWDAALRAGDVAHLGIEPDLGAFVRERQRSARLLVAIADQHGHWCDRWRSGIRRQPTHGPRMRSAAMTTACTSRAGPRCRTSRSSDVPTRWSSRTSARSQTTWTRSRNPGSRASSSSPGRCRGVPLFATSCPPPCRTASWRSAPATPPMTVPRPHWLTSCSGSPPSTAIGRRWSAGSSSAPCRPTAWLSKARIASHGQPRWAPWRRSCWSTTARPNGRRSCWRDA